MKIVVIGGTGLIGSKLVDKLGEHGHEAVPASPQTGVNTLTGEGLPEVLASRARLARSPWASQSTGSRKSRDPSSSASTSSSAEYLGRATIHAR